VPCFHALSTEDEEMAWNFFVHHYAKDEERDREKYVKGKGILYPRAGTLGGCTAHNAMITVVPHDSDWEHIADLTGDESWRAGNMWQYFQRVERCLYESPPRPGEDDPSGHGYQGWLRTSKVDTKIAFGDLGVAATVISAVRTATRRLGFWRGLFRGITWDPNDRRNRAARQGVTTTIPLATDGGKRNGARERIREVKAQFPNRLTIRMNTLATRVILDDDKRAVAVECWEAKNLYRADPNAAHAPLIEKEVYHCTREVILAGGAFNTPQLLMLSGIGPKDQIEKIGLRCLVERRGVGNNLQDRYEVGVVAEMKHPFSMLKDATFEAPADGGPRDACFTEWAHGKGLYTSNGSMVSILVKSNENKPDPDLFLFALPGNFHGYYPGYARDVVATKNTLTWAILKAHTNNTAGTVRIKSNDPRDAPDIDFHYFEEGNDVSGDDLQSVVEGVRFVRKINQRNHEVAHEIIPGPTVKDEDLGDWIRDNAWGHHASCSCRMGKPDDPDAVVDSRFRVIGTKGLRIVDASIFPRIPGFFIVTPIYMISEKAADVIVEDAGLG
jgi:choline dehydrogenase